MRNYLVSVLALVSLAGVGCASSLVLKKPNPDVLSGIPVKRTITYVVVKKITYHPLPGEEKPCKPKTVEEFAEIPVGGEYEVNFNSASFAKSEFSVTPNDNGTLKTVSLNSTPQAAEITKSVAELVGKIAPPKGADAALVPEKCGPVESETIIDSRIFKPGPVKQEAK